MRDLSNQLSSFHETMSLSSIKHDIPGLERYHYWFCGSTALISVEVVNTTDTLMHNMLAYSRLQRSSQTQGSLGGLNVTRSSCINCQNDWEYTPVIKKLSWNTQYTVQQK